MAGMKISLDAAMRARDVSQPRGADEVAAQLADAPFADRRPAVTPARRVQAQEPAPVPGDGLAGTGRDDSARGDSARDNPARRDPAHDDPAHDDPARDSARPASQPTARTRRRAPGRSRSRRRSRLADGHGSAG